MSLLWLIRMKIFSNSICFMQPIHTVRVGCRIFLAVVMVLSLSGIFFHLAPASAQGPGATPSQTASPPTVPSTRPLLPEEIQRLQREQEREKAPTPPVRTRQLPLQLPLIEEEPSPFELYIQGDRPLSISTEIKQYGYDLFNVPPSTFAPVDTVPVGPNYLLGPGDELRISLWGKVNVEYAAVIDRDGKISLPELGPLHLAGLTFAEAKVFLRKEFSRYYKPSEVKMNASLGQLRSIRVFIVGNARRPGSYTVSSFSTLINALFAAGGPSKVGTMRDIQVKREDMTIVHFDLYDFLLKGNKSKDIRLMPEDVIFIPPVGPLVGIAGSVKKPAIYELKPETRLLDLINMAGGLTALAFNGRVQVQRIENHASRVIFEGDMIDLEKDPEKNFPIRNGDLVKIFSVIGTTEWQQHRVARIRGAVRFPGEYTFEKGERLSSLIERAGGFTDEAYLKGAVFSRKSIQQLQQEQLDQAIDRMEQQLFSRSAATIEASLSPESARQEEMAAKQRKALIEKMRSAKALGRISIQLEPEPTESFIGSLYDLLLEDGDVLLIPEMPGHVQVIGAVFNPTAFVYDSEETVKAYLRKAGGLTGESDEDELYILKVDGTAISRREADGFMRSFMSVKLDKGDTIVVPEKIDRISYMREAKDITQILFQIATTAGILIVAF